MGCPIRHMLPWFLRNKVPPSGKHGPSSPVWNLSQSQPKRTLLAAFCVLYPGQWEKPRKRPEIKNLNKYVSDGFSPPFWLEGCDGAESDGVLAVIGQLDALVDLSRFVHVDHCSPAPFIATGVVCPIVWILAFFVFLIYAY